VNRDYNQQIPMTSQIQEPVVSPTTASKKKRPTQQVYVPIGRRHLKPVSPPPVSSSPEVKKQEEPTSSSSSGLLMDSSIVGYLKNSPEILKKPIDDDKSDSLEKQLKSLSLNQDTSTVDTKSVNKFNNTDDTGDSWDTLYDESGDCKNENLIKEVSDLNFKIL
jgi:hypothetical protein